MIKKEDRGGGINNYSMGHGYRERERDRERQDANSRPLFSINQQITTHHALSLRGE